MINRILIQWAAIIVIVLMGYAVFCMVDDVMRDMSMSDEYWVCIHDYDPITDMDVVLAQNFCSILTGYHYED